MPKTKNKWASAVASQTANREVPPRSRAGLSRVTPIGGAGVARFEHESAGTDAARVNHAALTQCIRADLWP